eukprot:3837070-Heterocapsa_arctica.AAC.1
MNKWVAPMMIVDTERPARQAASKKRALEQGARGVRAVAGKPSANIEVEKLVVQVGRLTLQNTKLLRGHTAQLAHVVRLPTESLIAQTMSEVGHAYYDGHRTKEQTDMPGPPHCCIWGALILALPKACE